MSYISPFNDMQNLDEHNHDFINQNTYVISQYNVVDEDYVVSYEPDVQPKFLPLNSVNIPISSSIDFDERSSSTSTDDLGFTGPEVPVKPSEDNREKNAKDSITIPDKPVTVKNDVYIHWDHLTHFYFASLTVISLFVMFRSMQKSH